MSDEPLPFSVTSVGDLLQRLAVVTDEQLVAAIAKQRKDGGMLGEILIEMEACTHDDVQFALALQSELRGSSPEEGMQHLVKAQFELRRRANERMETLGAELSESLGHT